MTDTPESRRTARGPRFACRCCGRFTLTEVPDGSHQICPVCFWQDDPVQGADPGYAGGANAPSLREARENWERHRVSEPRFARDVRAPFPDEEP